MTTIIRAADAAEFLTLVPRLAGFRPVRSVVLVPFRGGRTLGVMRIDLPDADADSESVAATLIGMVCKVREASRVAIVVYTDAAFAAADDALPQERLVRALQSKADACGLEVVDALCVAADGWGSYLDPECPAEGRGLAELEQPVVVGALPAEMREVAGDQSAGAGLPHKDPVATEHVAHALRALGIAIDFLCGSTPDAEPTAELGSLHPQALAAACALDDVPTLFEDALRRDPATMDSFDAAALSWCLMRPALRDVALMQWCAPEDEAVARGDDLLRAQLQWESGEEYPADLAGPMMGDGPRPDSDRLTRALELTRHAAALTPRAERPGPLSAAAWLAWALGRSTHAAWYAEAALQIEPEHGLGGIVMTMVAAGHLPEWAFVRPAA